MSSGVGDEMYQRLQQRLVQKMREYLASQGVTDATIVVEQPPSVALGEYAVPVFPLAKVLRKPPKKIAEEIVTSRTDAAGPTGC